MQFLLERQQIKFYLPEVKLLMYVPLQELISMMLLPGIGQFPNYHRQDLELV